MEARRSCQVLVAGGGPAGIAAAVHAAERGREVVLVDDNPAPGGQIWRGSASEEARLWSERLLAAEVRLLPETRIVCSLAERELLLDGNESLRIEYESLILATGARERFLPFPGWTTPGVVGAGGLQALAKGGLEVQDKRVAIAGSGPLLLAVGAYLREQGARIVIAAEQAPFGQVARFASGLAAEPRKLVEAAKLRWRIGSAPYVTGCWPVEARAAGEGLIVCLLAGSGKSREVACDYLACGFGLVANLELAALLGCRIAGGAVAVDEWQESSVAGVYGAGEVTGVAGLDSALIEGAIAGYAATGNREAARELFARRHMANRVQAAMNRAFALREELRALPAPETIVCRCEDVSAAQLQPHASWRSAKLHTRCGMGPCQGRVCGAATEFLYGWPTESARPPVWPVPVEVLAGISGPTSRSS